MSFTIGKFIPDAICAGAPPPSFSGRLLPVMFGVFKCVASLRTTHNMRPCNRRIVGTGDGTSVLQRQYIIVVTINALTLWTIYSDSRFSSADSGEVALFSNACWRMPPGVFSVSAKPTRYVVLRQAARILHPIRGTLAQYEYVASHISLLLLLSWD